MDALLERYKRQAVILSPDRRPERPRVLQAWVNPLIEDILVPAHIRENLDKAASNGGPFGPRGSGMSWEEVIYNPNADGTAITSSSETILVPDVNIPAGYMEVGRCLKYTIMGRQSTAITTPGTITFRLRWGGVGGVSMAASGAFAPDVTAAATNLTWMIEWWVIQRSVGTSGTSMTIGRVEWSDYNDVDVATLVTNLNMRMAPTSAPAVATVDTTIDKLLSPTYQSSVTTASCQAHFALLEALT